MAICSHTASKSWQSQILCTSGGDGGTCVNDCQGLGVAEDSASPLSSDPLVGRPKEAPLLGYSKEDHDVWSGIIVAVWGLVGSGFWGTETRYGEGRGIVEARRRRYEQATGGDGERA